MERRGTRWHDAAEFFVVFVGAVCLRIQGGYQVVHFLVIIFGNYPGPLRFTQKREEEDDHTEPPAKPTTEEDLVCARETNSHEYG